MRIERDQPVITIVNVPPTVDGKFNGTPVKDIYTAAKVPAVGPAIINAALLEKGYGNTTTIDPRFNPDGKFSDADMKRIRNSDILAATSMSRNRTATLDIFEDVKENNPNIVTVAGGFGPTLEHEKWAEHEYVDFTVIGEGPVSINELMWTIDNNGNPEMIKGLAFIKDGKIVRTQKRPLLTEAELAEIPIPFFPDYIKKNSTANAIIGGHGCPNNCEPCCVRGLHEGIYRKESDDKVIKQIRNLPERKGIFIVDDNWAPFERREDSKRIMRRIISEGLNNRDYYVQLDSVTVNKDPEVIGLLSKMGVFTVFHGTESGDLKVLKGMKKPATVKLNEDAIKKFKSANMHVHTMIILGADGETYESIERTIKWLMKLKADSAQLFPEIPLRGSRLAKRKGYLPKVENNTSRIDGHHVVELPPEGMTCLGLQKKTFEEYKKFYGLNHFINSFRPFPLIFKDPKRAGKLIGMNLVIGAYARKLINETMKSDYTKEWLEYLREVDQEVALKGRQKFIEENIVFENPNKI